MDKRLYESNLMCILKIIILKYEDYFYPFFLIAEGPLLTYLDLHGR